MKKNERIKKKKRIQKKELINPTKIGVCVWGGGGGMEGSNGPLLLIYLSSHGNHLYTSPDAPGLLIKFIWTHINHAAKTF